ncbi:sugar transferase [Kineococcus sp. SYSU DK005]|uniref:sugar transferase n=1 Tax=Kineococcus sp. SYSU DK005 TaxID=3383126 RepID=UPI003D7EB040
MSAFALSRVVPWHVDAVDVAVLAVMVLCLHAGGLYRSRVSVSLLDDAPRLLGGVLAAVGTQIALNGLLPGTAPRGTLLVQACALALAVLLARRVAYSTMRWARRTGRVRHTALILGAGHLGIRIGHVLRQHPEHGLDPVGFVDSSPRLAEGESLPAPVLSGYDQLATQIQDFSVRVVIVAFGAMREADLIEVLRTCDRLRCEIIIVPRLYEVHPTTSDTDALRGIPLVRVRRAPFRTPAWRVKRAFDVLFSAAALVLLSPVMAVCAAAVRWEGGPGIIFRQERVGLDGRGFDVLKFRSLKPVDDTESATNWNIKHDDRLGPVGRFLRQTSLDELPQLWNILRGDMSIVGPRPERPHFVDEFSGLIPRYTWRHRVPSGLTGWAQVNGLRGDTSIEDRAQFDNYYIENWSLWLDIKIILRTTTQVLTRAGG